MFFRIRFLFVMLSLSWAMYATGNNCEQAFLPQGRDFRFADLTGKDFSGRYMHEVTFHGANLQDANLSKARLPFSDFSKADLRGAKLSNIQFMGVVLISGHAIMVKPNFRGAIVDPKQAEYLQSLGIAGFIVKEQ